MATKNTKNYCKEHPNFIPSCKECREINNAVKAVENIPIAIGSIPNTPIAINIKEPIPPEKDVIRDPKTGNLLFTHTTEMLVVSPSPEDLNKLPLYWTQIKNSGYIFATQLIIPMRGDLVLMFEKAEKYEHKQ